MPRVKAFFKQQTGGRSLDDTYEVRDTTVRRVFVSINSSRFGDIYRISNRSLGCPENSRIDFCKRRGTNGNVTRLTCAG